PPGRHGLRRAHGRGPRAQGPDDPGSGAAPRGADHRDPGGRRRPHPGGRGIAGDVRGDLPPQHPCLRGDPADLPDHGPGRRRRRVLPPPTDVVVMVEKTSHMVITRPHVIRTVTGGDVGFEELGGARTHSTTSGGAHSLAPDESEAIEYGKDLLSYLPSNTLTSAPSYPMRIEETPTAQDKALDALVPDSPNQPYDMLTAVRTVLDDEEFLEVQPLFAPNVLVGF